MLRKNLNDLVAFVVVAREQSFTRAASQLGVSTSALSHAVRGLEERLGIRLLARSTRSVSPTEAGEHLLNSIAPRFDEIEFELAQLGDINGRPAGTVKINAPRHAISTILWPRLIPILNEHPDIQIEFRSESKMSDIIAERFDIGVRLKEALPGDMIAFPISEDLRMVAIASPSYFEKRPLPVTPHDLHDHQCINLRMLTYGGFYAWEFEKDGTELEIHVQGQVSFNDAEQIVQAAIDGFGIAYVMENAVKDRLANNTLVQVLDDWSPSFPGLYLYYPNRRHHSTAFAIVLDALKLN